MARLIYLSKLFLVVGVFFNVSFCNGQDEVSDTKYLSIGTKSIGLCFGNSNKYSGIRLNLWDKYFKNLNGINFSFKIEGSSSNGLQVAGLGSSTGAFNGISISGLGCTGRKHNGIGISGFALNCDTLQGLFVSPFIAATEPSYPNKVINGVAIGIVVVGAEKVNGISIAAFWCYSKELRGVSVAVSNKTENLHGLQIGLLNYAGNNPKLFRWLPIINFHK